MLGALVMNYLLAIKQMGYKIFSDVVVGRVFFQLCDFYTQKFNMMCYG